jgi:hypothetical protein
MLARQFANQVHSMEGGVVALPQGGAQTDLFLTNLFDDHSALVEENVKQHPSPTLLEVGITKNDTERILVDAFGLDVYCWGHVNQNGSDARTPQKGRGRVPWLCCLN